MSTTIIILAAGISSRMNSNLAKVMHKIAERPALGYLLETVISSKPNQIILVTAPHMKDVRDFADSEYSGIIHALQEERLGTAHAVKYALPHLDFKGKTIILYGDAPLISLDTLNKLNNKATDATVVAFHSNNPAKNGRLVTFNNNLIEIVEFNEATEEEKLITLCNSGIYAIKNTHLHELIPLIKNNNSKKEFYLTDIIKLISQREISRSIIEVAEAEVKNFNTREELSLLEDIMQQKIKSQLMNQGVSIIHPETSYIAYDFQAGIDTIIYPNVYIGKNVIVGKNVILHSFSHIEGANIRDNASIGPFARIRPSTDIAANVRIGNFVEVKNSIMKNSSKANHLSYIGDSEIGENSNIGAGTITCNFDGVKTKSKTIIGDNVVIGSNSSLIAPITIKNGAFIAAGSVVTENVGEDDLVLARSKQITLKGKAKALKNKKLLKL